MGYRSRRKELTMNNNNNQCFHSITVFEGKALVGAITNRIATLSYEKSCFPKNATKQQEVLQARMLELQKKQRDLQSCIAVHEATTMLKGFEWSEEFLK